MNSYRHSTIARNTLVLFSTLALGACGSSTSDGGTAAGTGSAGASATGASGGAGGSDNAGGSAGSSTDGSGTGGSSGGVSGTGAGGGAGVAGASAGGSAGGGGCPPITNEATTISDTYMTSVTVPVGKGGPIADGTYTMTAHVGYMGADMSNKMHTYTFRIAGSRVDLVGHDNADADKNAAFTATANSATGVIDMVTFCPVAGARLGAIDSYTATATELHLFESTKKGESVLTKK
jgi:hypothetical protein